MTMPRTTGAAMPTAGLRDHTESSIARQVNPSIGGSIVAQLSVTSRKAVPAGIVWPESPISGWCPTISRLDTIVETASRAITSVAKPPAVRVLAQKIRPRLVERVSTVFQVPCWSSLAKTSPATMAVRRGSNHCEAKPSTSSARANPLPVANRPNSVSFGGRDCPCKITTIATGASSAPSRTTRARYCAQSLRTSQRSAARRPGWRRATWSRGVIRVGTASVVVIGLPPAAARTDPGTGGLGRR